MDDYTFENGSKPTKPPPNLLERESFNKLIRIMGTFDLATGHADNFDDLLDSLNSELHDVLGHYRQANRIALQKNPVTATGVPW